MRPQSLDSTYKGPSNTVAVVYLGVLQPVRRLCCKQEPLQRSKEKNWRYKQNTRMLGLSRRRLALGAARRGARGVARGGVEWICSASR